MSPSSSYSRHPFSPHSVIGDDDDDDTKINRASLNIASDDEFPEASYWEQTMWRASSEMTQHRPEANAGFDFYLPIVIITAMSVVIMALAVWLVFLCWPEDEEDERNLDASAEMGQASEPKELRLDEEAQSETELTPTHVPSMSLEMLEQSTAQAGSFDLASNVAARNPRLQKAKQVMIGKCRAARICASSSCLSSSDESRAEHGSPKPNMNRI